MAVDVCSFTTNNPLAADLSRLGIPCHLQNERRIFEDRLVSVLRQVAQFRPTVVIANLSTPSYEVLRYLPDGIFRIAMAQSHDPGVYKQLQCYSNVVDMAVGVSQTIRDTIAALPGFSNKRVEYLPYGVPMPPNLEREPRTDPLRILYFGRLDREQKRVHLFPQILDALEASGIPFHWTIAGAGTEERLLKETMRTKSPRQTLSFPGKFSYSEIPGLLSSHDVFLLASDYEGLPLSLLEAMGRGLVPVVTDLESGIRDVVNESNGFRVPVNDVPAYARAIITLHNDRGLLARLSTAAHAHVSQRYAATAVADKWLEMLHTVPPRTCQWPASWRIKPILASPSPWRFHPLLRPVRRAISGLKRS